MKIFISYAKQQRHIAEDINAVLSARGHSVFFDRENLAPGLEYQTTIRRAVEDCEVFVFLISPESWPTVDTHLQSWGIENERSPGHPVLYCRSWSSRPYSLEFLPTCGL